MKLLVSVRDIPEARLALAAGVNLLDLKEPSQGSLGATEPSLWSAVSRLAAGQVPVSAALGELNEREPEQLSALCAATAELSYVKLGLAGMQEEASWLQQWSEFAQWLPAAVQPVAVAYADAHLAASPPVEAVIAGAAKLGWSTLLVDTFDKQQGNLLTHCSLSELGAMIALARRHGMRMLLAGSLHFEAIRAISTLPQRPDFIAVRGAVCSAGREGALDGGRLEELVGMLKEIG